MIIVTLLIPFCAASVKIAQASGEYLNHPVFSYKLLKFEWESSMIKSVSVYNEIHIDFRKLMFSPFLSVD